MDLQKLFEIQKGLDNLITKEHPVQEGEDRLAKKILALQVELGELANEWRGFKYWSRNQKPRRAVYEICKYCEGRKTLGFQFESCWYCGGTGLQVVKRPLLEEYVDCLHFALSIGLDILENLEIYSEPIAYDDIIEQFNRTFEAVSYFYTVVTREHETQELVDEYKSILSLMFGLGGKLGFTWQQIEEVYIKKNRENFRRQEEGY